MTTGDPGDKQERVSPFTCQIWKMSPNKPEQGSVIRSSGASESTQTNFKIVIILEGNRHRTVPCRVRFLHF